MFNNTLLVIAYYFPPMGLSGVQRTLKFVKYLPQFGWRALVLTVLPTSYYAFDESLNTELELEGIEIFRASGKNLVKQNRIKNKTVKFPSYFKQKLGRAFLQTIYMPDSKIRWKNAAIGLGEKILEEHKINAIFATAPPFTDFLVANELSKNFGKPFVVDYRDNWVDNPFHFYPTPFHKRYCIKLESEILTRAQKAIVTTRYSKEILLKRYRFLSHDDVIIVPHGYDPEDFALDKSVEQTSEKFVITHSGLFQDNRTPKYFLKALASFVEGNPEAKKKIEARLVGLMRPGHLKLIKKLGLENNVLCTGYVPHSEAVKHLLESDVLWLMLDDTIRSPGKLYEYFGARKPLLVCAPDGIIRRTAAETNAAITTDPKDERAIKRAIGTYFNLWKNDGLPVANEDFAAKFDRKKLTGDLARELALIAEV